jgi:hypothetical protein
MFIESELTLIHETPLGAGLMVVHFAPKGTKVTKEKLIFYKHLVPNGTKHRTSLLHIAVKANQTGVAVLCLGL